MKAKKMLHIAKKAFHLIWDVMKKYIHDPVFRNQSKYASLFEKERVNEKIIFYESYHGSSMTESPYAIFKRLYNDQNYKDFIHVWGIDELDEYNLKLYKGKPNVKFVKLHSKEYIKFLAQAKYLINNVSFPPYFQKKQGQIYINTWHGTPLKTLGKDMKGTIGQHKNIQRNFLHCDYILNPNKFTADIIVNSHDLDGIYNGYIVDEGYPRIDLTINADKEEVYDKLRKVLGEIDKNKKIVLYAPTWRGEVGNVENTNAELHKILDSLYHKMPDDHILLLKVHRLTYQHIKNDKKLREICIPNWIDTNELLSVVDILITDYSSIFFDYLVTRKPILFYVYDREEYEKNRGLYLNLEDLPGPLCYTVDEVISYLKTIDNVVDNFESRYKEMLEQFCYNDDGKCTDRIIDIIFEGRHTSKVYKTLDENKKNIILYCGGFNNNGITTSAINLTNNIDYSKYNVVIIDKNKYDQTSEANIKRINPKVKKLYRVGSMNVTVLELFKHLYILARGTHGKNMSLVPEKLYKRELARLFGDTKFDIAIDFSGYVPFWTLLFAFGDFQKKSIFLHNDMYEEYNKKIEGKFKHKRNLNIIFPLYSRFDKIVSVAEHTMNQNVSNLKNYIPADKAVYVYNSINYEKILALSESQLEENTDLILKEYYITKYTEQNGYLNVQGYKKPQKNKINFVNMGRLSPEKDQAKLLTAFSKICEKHQDVNLYIIGEGVLESALKKIVKNLGIESKVVFTGQLENPFPLIKECDCFVLSSNHEGQPMVLLESLVLGKPIIATDIPGNRSVLQGGYGLLVENSVDGLVAGMEKFVNNQLDKFNQFDYKQYNKLAMEMFYNEVCLPTKDVAKR